MKNCFLMLSYSKIHIILVLDRRLRDVHVVRSTGNLSSHFNLAISSMLYIYHLFARYSN